MSAGVAADTRPTAAVEISDLAFRWDRNDADVLVIDSLTINQGEHLFIEGPSGSGKSTLLSLLSGVALPRTGTVKVLDTELSALGGAARDHFRANHIGYIFQMFNLIPYLSVIENVTLPCRFSQQRHTRALQDSGSIEAEALRLLNHLDMADKQLINRPVTSLSVGQQQRVAAARALIGAPELMIADEPTSSLDTNRREAFINLLFEECSAAGSSLIFVSHDTTLQPLFRRTIHLADINRASHSVSGSV